MAYGELLLTLSLYVFLASCVAANSFMRRELTTRSYDSLGFHENIYHSPDEDQIIIGVMDSGIWPEALSFRDDGLGPPPAKWKGICDVGNSSIPFKCNNKIIGARMYPFENWYGEGNEISPRDMDGHGTFCAATAAGVPVKNVSVNGVGLGTARGAVPRARIAVYKVCWGQIGVCIGNDRAISDALNDGVDIISISNARNGGLPFRNNMEAIGSLEAVIKGVLVVYGAGNNCTLDPYPVSNTYPWALTIANSAGSGTDYVSYVALGDGKRLEGGGFLNTKENSNNTMYPLVRVQEVTSATDPEKVGQCNTAWIKPELVKGKIIICDEFYVKDWFYDHLGCAGVIINGAPDKWRYEYFHDVFHFRKPTGVPLVLLRSHNYNDLIQYYNKTMSTGQTPTATIEKSAPAPDTAPRITICSSRGPSLSDINILKPDISAPGVNEIDAVKGNSSFYFMTGTSMSTPLVAGVAAYLKTLHPTWSATAIKSALMTTATPMTDYYSYVGPLAYGSGQVTPLQAADPGLVYNITEMDYIKYLCQFANLSSQYVNEFRHMYPGHQDEDCSKLQIEKDYTLNYPSFAVPVTANQPFTSIFKRTLTNVGNSSIANYKVIVSAPRELTVKVEPSVLAFTEVGQELSYTLTVSGQLDKTGKEVTIANLAATIVWTDGIHQVKSPISVFERPADFDEQYMKTRGV